MSFLKSNVPVSYWPLFCLVNFSEPSPRCYLLLAVELAPLFPSAGIVSAWASSCLMSLSLLISSHIRLNAINGRLLLFQQDFDPFFFPSVHQHPSLAACLIPPQQPLHGRSFVINVSYELSVFEQERFTFDRCLASSNFTQQRSEIPFCRGTLVQREALGRQMCWHSCPCIPP